MLVVPLICLILGILMILDTCQAYLLSSILTMDGSTAYAIKGDKSGLGYSLSNDDHLVVLSHGIMGSHTDLSYLSSRLERVGCTVLNSKSNEFARSLKGIRQGGLNLADEVVSIVRDHPHLQRISFVGNSLGGMYARYAVRCLYNNDTQLIAGLIPHSFMVSDYFDDDDDDDDNDGKFVLFCISIFQSILVMMNAYYMIDDSNPSSGSAGLQLLTRPRSACAAAIEGIGCKVDAGHRRGAVSIG